MATQTEQSDNGHTLVTNTGPAHTGAKKPGLEKSIQVETTSLSQTHKPTGSRTAAGKERSKRNALKHGIFSSVAVLKGESRSEYESLLSGLWDVLRPEGSLEEILVEKLATILWRHRRLILAEAGEIGKNAQFVEWDQEYQQRRHANAIVAGTDSLNEKGMIGDMSNPVILGRCFELLFELRDGLKADGFQLDRDVSILTKIYGDSEQRHVHETLRETYAIWQETSEGPENERQREGYASPSECRANVLEAINAEIQRLKGFQKAGASVEAERTRLEILRRSVPEGPGLERLLRYEASLERHFDRALSQLERIQRMRMGQTSPLPIKVELSS